MFKESIDSITKKVSEMASDVKEVRDSVGDAVPKFRPVRAFVRNRVKRIRR